MAFLLIYRVKYPNKMNRVLSFDNYHKLFEEAGDANGADDADADGSGESGSNDSACMLSCATASIAAIICWLKASHSCRGRVQLTAAVQQHELSAK